MLCNLWTSSSDDVLLVFEYLLCTEYTWGIASMLLIPRPNEMEIILLKNGVTVTQKNSNVY
jgi:hypothetical protein